MPIAETTIISFVKSMSGSAGVHWPGGTGASRRFQKSANSSRLLITSRNGLSDLKLLTQGRGYGLVPPKRSGRGSPVISGPGNNVIGSDFPRQTSGDFCCVPANNESRAQSNSSAGFVINSPKSISRKILVKVPKQKGECVRSKGQCPPAKRIHPRSRFR